MPTGCAEGSDMHLGLRSASAWGAKDANLAGDLASRILGFFQNSRRKSAGFPGRTKAEAKDCSSEIQIERSSSTIYLDVC
jgi:hypothetical protein